MAKSAEMSSGDANPNVPLDASRPFHFSIRTMLVAFVIASIGFWLLSSVYNAYQSPWDAYATMYGAESVVGYMRQNDDKWPQNWEDLKPVFESQYAGTAAISFDELKERLDIDFQVDPQELLLLRPGDSESNRVPFRVIRLRNGNDIYWAGAEPNEMILEYLTRAEVHP